jgi:hypothetical protein
MTGEIADQSAECKLIAPDDFLEGTGNHFIQEDSLDEIGRTIAAFVRGG